MLNALHKCLKCTLETSNCVENVSLVDGSGNILFASHGHDAYGLPAKRLRGTNVMDRVHPDDMIYVQEAFARMIKTQLLTHVHYRFKNDYGEWLEIESDGGPYEIPGQYAIVSRITKTVDLLDVIAQLVCRTL